MKMKEEKNKKKTKNKKGIVSTTLMVLILCIGVCLCLIPIFKDLKFGLDLKGGFEVLYKVESVDGSPMTSEKVTATYKTLSKRIDSLGVNEPEIIIEGDKIRVKLAGVKDADSARKQLSTVATLSFRDTKDNLLMESSVLNAGGAKVSQDANGNPAVALSVKDKDKFYAATNKLSKQDDNLMVIWLDYNEDEDSYSAESSSCGTSESNCLSAASVSQGFASDVIIQGNFTDEEVENLVDLINSGSLPSKLTEVSSKTVGASFGDQTLEKTFTAGVVGIALIFLLLIAIYHFSGVISAFSLIFYTFLVFFTSWVIGSVLTLPGIAALVLGIGMAVDANVILFSRIQDELYRGRSLELAFKNGSKSSFRTILDSNLTTLLVAIIMFVFGESSVKGFATMLIITVIVTMFTMVLLTRVLMNLFIKSGYFNDKLKLFINIDPKKVPNVSKGEKVVERKIDKVDFVKFGPRFTIFSIIIIVIGGIFFAVKGFNLGIDYQAGSDITVVTKDKVSNNKLKDDLKELKLDLRDIERNDDEVTMNVKDVLDAKDIKDVTKHFEDKYEAKVDISVISNIVKEELTKNAILSVLISMIGIIIYISIRFKFSYAIASVSALVHDVLVIFALFSIFRLEISVMFIAAILAIIGYSINNTIVTFDRIRENLGKIDDKKLTREKLYEVANKSIADTFLRSIYTSLTTLLPVLALIVFASSGILTFNLAMLFGLIAGTYSSLFIASYIFLLLERKNVGKKRKPKKIYTDDIEEKKIKGVNC